MSLGRVAQPNARELEWCWDVAQNLSSLQEPIPLLVEGMVCQESVLHLVPEVDSSVCSGVQGHTAWGVRGTGLRYFKYDRYVSQPSVRLLM